MRIWFEAAKAMMFNLSAMVEPSGGQPKDKHVTNARCSSGDYANSVNRVNNIALDTLNGALFLTCGEESLDVRERVHSLLDKPLIHLPPSTHDDEAFQLFQQRPTAATPKIGQKYLP